MLFEAAEEVVQPYRITGVLQSCGEGTLDVGQNRLHFRDFVGAHLPTVGEEVPSGIGIQRRVSAQDSLNQGVFVSKQGYQSPPVILPAGGGREAVPEFIGGVHSLEYGADAHFGRRPVGEGSSRENFHDIAQAHLQELRTQAVDCNVQRLAGIGGP